jgi:C-terminal processing protease CtpA/Prc
MPLFGSSLNVGAMVEPLTSQMAEYLGVQSGLMVKQVARKSEAAAAGLKAFDVILKVGPEAIKTISDWDRSLHANQGKPVQVTILRDKKQQTVTLQVDSKHHGELELEDLLTDGECPLVAEIDPESIRDLAKNLSEDYAAVADALKERAQAGGMEGFQLSPEQAEAFRKQAEELRESIKTGALKIDQKQIEQMKQQMEELRKSFKPEDFKFDPKQMEELNRQMDKLRLEMKNLNTPMD